MQNKKKTPSEKCSTEESHQLEGEILKSIIFGGLDGILSSFAIIAGAAGGSLSTETILILGFSNIFADALSMGVGEYLSTTADNEYVISERKREQLELETSPEEEIRGMIDVYTAKGMLAEDASLIARTMSKYKDFFVDIMVTEELKLQLPEPDHQIISIKESVVMFSSFAVFGSLPLLGYIIIPFLFPEMGVDSLFTAACIITGMVLVILGCVKSLFCAAHWVRSGTETLLLGGACATTAYTIGLYVNGIVGGAL